MKRKYLGDSQSDIEKINKKAFIEEHKRKYDNNIFIENKRFKLMKKENIINGIQGLNIKEPNDVNLDDLIYEEEGGDIPSIRINHQDSEMLNFNEDSLEDRMYSMDEVVTIMRQYKSNVIRELERYNIRYHVEKHDLEGLNIY